MSCEGWTVGDHCFAEKNFKVVQKQMHGPELSYAISVGDEGEIKRINDAHPASHWMSVYWFKLKEVLELSEDLFVFLKKK